MPTERVDMAAPSGMVKVYGAGAGRDSWVYLEREFAVLVFGMVWFMEQAGATLWMTEGHRPDGVEADRYVRDESKTSTGGSNAWYQMGRADRGETPSALPPGVSLHSTGRALDCNAPTARDMQIRAQAAANVGIGFPDSSETWHAERTGLPRVSLADFRAALDATPEPVPAPAPDVDMHVIGVAEMSKLYLVTPQGYRAVTAAEAAGVEAVTGRPRRVVPFPLFWAAVSAINSLNRADSARLADDDVQALAETLGLTKGS